MPDSTPIAYSLVPWVRRGLATRLAPGAPAKNYATLPAAVAVNSAAAIPGPPIRLLGPGEITSLDRAAVIRTDPRDGATDFEPNYLAVVEFALPDLPWLFTPAAPDGARLRPWICLVAIADGPGVSITPRRDGPAVLELTDPVDLRAELPDLTHIDAWAHAQVTGDSLSGAALNAALDANTSARLSRLVAPRQLAPDRSYIACIVPTWRAGVNAGLGAPVDEADLAPAWGPDTPKPLRLPVYYSFRFHTGPGGDFKSLARRIEPPAAPLDAGKRVVDLSAPGFGAAAAPGVTLDFEGALRTRNAQPSPWPPGAQTPYEAQLRKVLAPVDLTVAPPVYGKTQSGQTLPQGQNPPVWLRQLNLDPRMRAAAGAGAQVVQREQEALVAASFDQLGEIEKANQLLRQAQLARGAASSMQRRHLASIASDGAYLQITAPLHARVRVTLGGDGALTLRGQIEKSRMPVRSVSAALRKLTRSRGPVGRQLNAAQPSQIVQRLNQPANAASALTAAGALQLPRGMVALDDVAPDIKVANMSSRLSATTTGWVAIAVVNVTTGLTGVASPTVAAPIDPHRIGDVTGGGAGGVLEGGGVLTGGGTVTRIDWSSDPDVPALFKGTHTNLPATFVFPTDATALQQVTVNFRTAANSINAYLNTAPAAPPDPPPLGGSPGLAAARAQLHARLDPALTIAARLRARFPLGAGDDLLQPLRNAPQFPQPMYSALAELSPSWMLPGIETVPVNAAALLQTNPRFVEAFMVGLNEALARELLWREFPIGLTATYFHNFWGGAQDDIPAIDGFDATAQLGDHTAGHATGGNLVLLIRADLFRRYPSAVVSAVPAKWNADGKTRSLDQAAARKWPLFRGAIGTDVNFFGFDVADPRGPDSGPAGSAAGFYFLIEEHVSEPRFGLEPDPPMPTDGTWNDLSWKDVGAMLDHGFLNPQPASAPAPREGVVWGQSSAAMAYILMRRPFRVAMHGRALLPATQ